MKILDKCDNTKNGVYFVGIYWKYLTYYRRKLTGKSLCECIVKVKCHFQARISALILCYWCSYCWGAEVTVCNGNTHLLLEMHCSASSQVTYPFAWIPID